MTHRMVRGQMKLKQQVLDQGLCTGCGACVNLCPYQAISKDNIVFKDICDRETGRCYRYCPRTPTDLQAMRRRLFDQDDMTPELGAVKGFYVTRSADPHIRSLSQHGGTVTTLITLALEAGVIDTAVLAEGGSSCLPRAAAVSDPTRVKKFAKSKFAAVPMVAAFNAVVRGNFQKIGIVATPCQALALSKMKMKEIPKDDSHIDKLKLIVGLFCGWVLSWREFRELLAERTPPQSIIGMDILPSKYQSMEVLTEGGCVTVSLGEVEPCVREACKYCPDMTAEFSDISVGSARLPEGWQEAKGWNQVIVRTTVGHELLQLARDRGLLEFRNVPNGNFEKLKQASANKKRAAMNHMACKSDNREKSP